MSETDNGYTYQYITNEEVHIVTVYFRNDPIPYEFRLWHFHSGSTVGLDLRVQWMVEAELKRRQAVSA